jgi:hypothetical protein
MSGTGQSLWNAIASTLEHLWVWLRFHSRLSRAVYRGFAGSDNPFLLDGDACVLEKERLVSLTSGKADSKAGSVWSIIPNIYSIGMDDGTETDLRMIYVEDHRIRKAWVEGACTYKR